MTTPGTDPLYCFPCVVSRVPQQWQLAVTIANGTAFCTDHAKYLGQKIHEQYGNV